MIAFRFVKVLVAAALLNGTVSSARAQSADVYPSRPLRFMVAFAPGGGADIIARLLGSRLADALGKPVVIENRPGAAGNIGVAAAAKLPADGYTIVFAYSGTHAINPTLYPDVGFKNSDFAPVILSMSVPQVMTISANLPVNGVPELIALAKSKPGKLNFGTSGTFNHVSAVLFNEMAGINVTHIPYGGTAASVMALTTGDIHFQLCDPAGVLPQVKAGKLRMIAVTSEKRSSLFPDVPAVAEAGLSGYDATSWNGILVRAGTPPEIIARLNSELNKILATSDMRGRLADLGYEVVGGTPEQFGAHLAREEGKWAKVVKAANIKP